MNSSDIPLILNGAAGGMVDAIWWNDIKLVLATLESMKVDVASLTTSSNDNATGANQTLSAVSTTNVRLTNASLTSVDMIPAGISAYKFILINATGSVVTINNDSGATAANRILTGTGSALSLASGANLWLTYDATSLRWRVVGGSGSGGTTITANRAAASDGSGGLVASVTTASELAFLSGVTSSVQDQLNLRALERGTLINYITNYGAVTDTAGWATYKDLAGALPVDGTGGTPALTFTRTTVTPLRGVSSFLLTKTAANLQGEGASYDFTIDTADQGKPLAITLDYQIASGTYSGGSNTTDSDLTCYIYDVTNAVVIQPSGFKFDGTVAGINYAIKASFQSASNSTSYRLIFHVATTSASAYSLEIDTVSVSPIVTTTGAAMSDEVAYTPTYTGFGTVSTTSANWARQGQFWVGRGRFVAGTTTATEARIALPAGLVSASNITTVEVAGVLAQSANGVATFYTLMEPSVSYITIGLQNSGTPGASKMLGTGINTGATVEWMARVPIAGWSSNSVVSSNTDTRVVAASYRIASGATSTTSAPFNFDTKLLDTHNAVTTGASWKFTAPVPGIYGVSTIIGSGAATRGFAVYKNGTLYATIGQHSASLGAGGSLVLIELIAGDFIDIRMESLTATSSITNSTINIFRLTGPSQIAASESVNARYFASATSISGTLATVVWTTKDYDSHSGMSSGLYTVSAPGKYEVEVDLALSGTFALNNQTIVEIQKNSTATKNVTKYAPSAITNEQIQIKDTIQCVAGDVIRVQLSSAATTPAIVSSNTKNVITIKRVGN